MKDMSDHYELTQQGHEFNLLYYLFFTREY